MDSQKIEITASAIGFMESHLGEKPDLETVARAVHYSKYHLHRTFAETVGLTIHDYMKRRQLTEAARLLVSTKRPILEVALDSGYESQQAFTDAFRAMYKQAPARYRESGRFYPLLLPYTLKKELPAGEFQELEIHAARKTDIPGWMELLRLVVDGYPCLDEKTYEEQLVRCIADGQGLVLRDGQTVAGAMAFSRETGEIGFLGVHPQYGKKKIVRLFLARLVRELSLGKNISITTFRERDRADTHWRRLWKELGFEEAELLTEFGYPTQRLVWRPESKNDERKNVDF